MGDLIFVSLEDWDEIWRRNQFLCAGLARRHPGSQILFVAPARNVSASLRAGRLNDLHAESMRSVLPGITVLKPLKLLPNSLPAGRRFNEWRMRQEILTAARKLGLQRPLLWLNPHSAVHLCGRLDESAIVYDVTDDWTTLTQSDAERQLVIRQDADLCRRADSVIVCSQRLYEMKQALARNLRLIPNGVDSAHYASILDDDGPPPPAAASWRRPVLGYTGSIHPDRVDLALLEGVARARPEATLALIGPLMLAADQRARLEALPNVVLTGPKPYEELPGWMRAFDVCMTPHLLTAFTESLNPIKLWEYLAAGKPIVSTPVAGFRDYPELVHLGEGVEGFLKAIQEALTEDPGLPDLRRQAEAGRHSWDARLDEVETAIDAAIRRREVDAPGLSFTPAAPGESRPSLSVVIVSFNTREMTLDCLRTLLPELRRLDAEVWVVDNASTDGSPDAIQAEFPAIRIIANLENVGFGGANNQAMGSAKGDYLLLLNSDAFVKPGAVASLIAHLDAHPEVALVGPRLLNADGSLQPSCYRFPSPVRCWLENLWISAVAPPLSVLGDYRRWQHDGDREVEWVVGACMVVRRAVYEQIGGFDRRFFMYAEETDWQKRMQAAGWKIGFTPSAVVTHLGGASGASDRARINQRFFESLDHYEWKHHGIIGLISVRAAMVIGCFLRAVGWSLVLALVPRRRPVALSKVRLAVWLCLRQAGCLPRRRLE